MMEVVVEGEEALLSTRWSLVEGQVLNLTDGT